MSSHIPPPTARIPLSVFAATRRTQGRRDSDFCFVPEGELVHFAPECDTDQGNPDGGCGCTRAMLGLVCGRGTTTFRVIETMLTRDELIDIYRAHLETTGFAALLSEAELADEIDSHLTLAASFPSGTILDRRGDVIQVRCSPES